MNSVTGDCRSNQGKVLFLLNYYYHYNLPKKKETSALYVNREKTETIKYFICWQSSNFNCTFDLEKKDCRTNHASGWLREADVLGTSKYHHWLFVKLAGCWCLVSPSTNPRHTLFYITYFLYTIIWLQIVLLLLLLQQIWMWTCQYDDIDAEFSTFWLCKYYYYYLY